MTTTACGREEGLGATTLLELLRARAEVQGAEVAVIFLRDGERDEDRITYQELDARARAIAAVLLDRGLAGQRVLLLYPPGIEYIAGLFGCAYAGVVAVPAYPPDPARLARSMPRMLSIARDAGVRVALTIAPIRELAGTLWAQLAELRDLELLATDALTDPAGWRDPDLDPDHLALLQYTSGSVATPKGVMLTHRNVLANEAMIRQAGSTERDRLFAAWLPPYHDMGLFAGIVHPIYLGIPTVLMSPESFLRRPHRWLMAISRFQATITVAPDFAFDLCVRRHAGERGEELDLSSLRVAFNGAEPVRAATMDRFTETFGRHGFRRSAFNPCYGMAEATLAVSAGDRDADPIVRRFDAQALEQHRVVAAPPGASGGRTLVGCGRALGDGQVRVVAPETRHPCGPDQVGEIWIAGPHVAAGYWNRPEDSAHAFQARLADGDGPFLRTGDLGFVSDGELFVTGRLKDLIILRGRNHYPHDIEGTVQDVHPALRPGCGAAFGFEVGDQERLVVVQEVDGERAPPLEQLLADARQAIAEAHDVVPHELVLIRRGSVPKTTSGKIQRRACAAAYRAGELEIVARWQAPAEPAAGPAPSAGVTAEAIQRWLVRELSRQVGVPEAEIDEQRPLFAYGLDSIVAVELTLDLEAWLGRPVPASTPYDYPTIQAIAAALSASTVAAPAAASAAAPAVAASAPGGPEPVAIVGMACRFPGAPDLDAFWSLLVEGRDAITEVPRERWDVDACFDAEQGKPGHLYSRWGGFVDGIDRFDPEFFGISPREAARIEPQQRMFLEVVWHGLEDAGVSPARLAGSATGVFVGVYNNDYRTLYGDQLELIDAYYGTGNALCIVANRVSYLLDLQGPSVAVDTACSSSLVSLHLACQALRAGDCDLAIAGGVNAILSPENHIYFSQARALAADGRCKTFDARADGYVRSEGAGAVVLKTLSRAIADGDRIYAVVRGSAVNQDGRSNGLTAPNGLSQQRVIRRALASAGVSPAELGYVEAHGSGTPIGDSMELTSLAEVLGEGRAGRPPAWVGAVKTNIGHLESASGIAGIIKTALALRRELIPKNLHFRELNRHVAGELPLRVAAEPVPWPRGGHPRIAGVSSFGFGGTNAHVVLEEAPAQPSWQAAPRPRHLVVLSAASDEALRELARRHAEAIAPLDLGDVAYAAGAGRAHHTHRLAVVGSATSDVADTLRAVAGGKPSPAARIGRCRPHAIHRVGVLFTGQGSQYPGMGKALFESEPRFRAALERCDALLRPRLGTSLLAVLYGGDDPRLHQTAYAQPALFALEWSLSQLWSSWGLEPAALLGHSLGEYVAATVAGAMSLEDALELVAERGRLMQSLPADGSMATVFAPAADVAAAIGSLPVAIAATNGPRSTVISGRAAVVNDLSARLEAQQVNVRPLRISHASHSALMDPILDRFEAAAARVRFAPTRVAIASNLTGALLPVGHRFDAAYFRRHLRETVRFAEGLDAMLATGCDVFLELGPSPTLASLGHDATFCCALDRRRDDYEAVLDAVGTLYVAGVELDWEAFGRGHAARKVALPRYPFQATAYWMPFSRRNRGESVKTRAPHPLLSRRR